MQTDYNPQLGYRRTIFGEDQDFLLKIVHWEEDEALTFLVDTFRGAKAAVRISFPREDVLRFQMFPPQGERASARAAWEEPKTGWNPVFEFERGVRGDFAERENYFEYRTRRLRLCFRKDCWEMTVYFDGRLLTRQQAFDTNVDNRWKVLPTGFTCDGEGKWKQVHECMYLYSDEAFWGFGEKFTNLDKRGQQITCWQKDALSTNTEESYKTHPFFISSRGYAVLLNTFSKSSFDMGASSQVSYSMCAQDGGLDYVLWAGKERDYKGLLSAYIEMTGKIPMIPKWAFGFWMSKCSYQSRQEIEELVVRAEKEEIPIDVVHIDNWQKKESMGLWEWDEERFPDPEGMILWLKKHGVRLSLWMYPYLQENSPAFPELAQRGFFIKNHKGEPALFYATADSKYQAACFDFTNPDFLAWYKERVMAVLAMGVSVIKTDFSEAVPEDSVFWDGSDGTRSHNKLTYLYAKTIYEYMQESGKKTGITPLLWGRSGFAGSHRIPAAWAGDSSSAQNNHGAILRGGLSLALSGVAFWGFDLGGFYNTGADGNECPPTEEEYLRSVEMGFFMPLARAHGKTPREPWNFSGHVLEVFRKYDKFRHWMMPYLYSMACASCLESTPMLRPMLLEFPEDLNARGLELQYMLGKSLLVAPAFERESYGVYLPEGNWLELATGKILEGGGYHPVRPSLDEIPVFLRENSLLLGMGQPQSPAAETVAAETSAAEAETDLIQEENCDKLEVILHFRNEMQETFYDTDRQGGIRTFAFHAYLKEEEGTLCIDTDRELARVRLFTTHQVQRISINGSISENKGG